MIHSSKIKLSVALATYNEERCLADCLKSVNGLADEIVVVDGSSTDETVKIAKDFGARVIVTTNKPIFHINKQMAIDECEGEWILQLDADEIIPSELADEIRQVIESAVSQSPISDCQPKIANRFPVAYWIKRKNYFLGKWLKKGGQYPDPVIRLFKKGKAYLPCKSVHEQMEVEGEIGWLKNPMIHIPTPSFATYLTKSNRYTSLSAKELLDRKIEINLFSFVNFLFYKPFKTFFSLFFRHRGFLDGFPGFVFAFYSGLHHASAFIKYWEMKNSSKKIDIEKDWI